ncbi:uncharacterized protein LOC112000737 [Quercus suber]|uniref:uncharacterized protein LOC112000737 n=1 Tax=Quercus suber TaxID=58331 RepID=UPI000CE25E6D|nr:uncharacterized protein LOC112000737 [Quercus suber]
MCSHCGKLGHVMEKCYKLVGFPPGYKQKGRVAMANEVLVEDDQGNSGIQQVNSFPFTSEQYQQLISMLSSHASTSGGATDVSHSANSTFSGNVCNAWSNSISLDLHHSIFAVNPVNKTAYGNDVWILDTGATDHIVHSLSLFTQNTSSISTFVQLPNGEKVTVTHIGTIQVTSTLKLENDLICWKMIGVGELHDNLYLLHTTSSCNSVSEASSTLESVFQSFVNSMSDSMSPSVTKPYLWHMRSKFDPRFSSCVFLGYPFGVKGYKLLDLTTKRLFVSRDVHFLETIFPFVSPSHSFSPHTSIPLPHLFPSVAQPLASLFDFPTSTPASLPQVHNPDGLSTLDILSSPNLPLDDSVPAVADLPVENSADLLAPNPSPSVPSVIPSTNVPSFSLRKSSRVSKPPTFLNDFKCSTVVSNDLTPFANKLGIHYPLSTYLNSSKLSSNYAHFCSLIFAIPKPTSYNKAVKDPNW